MVQRWLKAGGVAALGFGLVIAAVPVALAQPSTKTVRLVLVRGERTETCSDGAAMARSVSARLGRDVFAESAAESIEGVIQHEGGRWEARLYVRDAHGGLVGSRTLASESPDCAALDAAVTLAIALVIDPEAAFRPPPPAEPSISPARTPVLVPGPAASEAVPARAPALPPSTIAPALPPSCRPRRGVRVRAGGVARADGSQMAHAEA